LTSRDAACERPAQLQGVGAFRGRVSFVAVVGATIAYILLADRLGFLIVAPLAVLAMFVAFGVRPTVAVVVAVAGTLLIWYAFYKLLRVPLAWGVLERFEF